MIMTDIAIWNWRTATARRFGFTRRRRQVGQLGSLMRAGPPRVRRGFSELARSDALESKVGSGHPVGRGEGRGVVKQLERNPGRGIPRGTTGHGHSDLDGVQTRFALRERSGPKD